MNLFEGTTNPLSAIRTTSVTQSGGRTTLSCSLQTRKSSVQFTY